MTDEEHEHDWPEVDEAAEVVRAYEQACRFSPHGAQLHSDCGIVFLKLGD